jgi:death-on-curing protein
MSEREITYPQTDQILQIHEDIISEDDDAESGILNEGHVEFSIDYIQHGYYGEVPESLDEKALHLFRLLAANHAFADGNKRTALNATWTFYAMNDRYFDYGEEIKAILKMFAVMERMIDLDEVEGYFSEIAVPFSDPRVPMDLLSLTEIVDVIHELGNNAVDVFRQVEERHDDDTDIYEFHQDEIEEILENIIRSIRLANRFIQEYSEEDDDSLEETYESILDVRESLRMELEFLINSSEINMPDELIDEFGLDIS